MVEELHLGHPDDGGRPPLLLLAQRPGLLRRHPGHPGLAARGQQVVHLLAGRRPRRDGGRDAVLDVVGVGGDDEGALPVVGHGLVGHAGSLPPAAQRAAVGRRGCLGRRPPGWPGSAPRRAPARAPAPRRRSPAGRADQEHVAQAVGVGAAEQVGQPARALRVGRAEELRRLAGRQRRRECRTGPAHRRRAAPTVAPAVNTRAEHRHAERRSRAAGRCSPHRRPCRCAPAGTAASAADASVGLAIPTPTPSTASPATSTRQVESASTSAMQQPADADQQQPAAEHEPRRQRLQEPPTGAGHHEAQRRQRDEHAAGLQRREPDRSTAATARCRSAAAKAAPLSSSAPSMIPLNERDRNSRTSSIGARPARSTSTQTARTTRPPTIGPQATGCAPAVGRGPDQAEDDRAGAEGEQRDARHVGPRRVRLPGLLHRGQRQHDGQHA